MNKSNNFYICFSTKVRKFLDQNGSHWVDKGFHKESGHPYWVFQRNNRLRELLDRYDIEK